MQNFNKNLNLEIKSFMILIFNKSNLRILEKIKNKNNKIKKINFIIDNLYYIPFIKKYIIKNISLLTRKYYSLKKFKPYLFNYFITFKKIIKYKETKERKKINNIYCLKKKINLNNILYENMCFAKKHKLRIFYKLNILNYKQKKKKYFYFILKKKKNIIIYYLLNFFIKEKFYNNYILYSFFFKLFKPIIFNRKINYINYYQYLKIKSSHINECKYNYIHLIIFFNNKLVVKN